MVSNYINGGIIKEITLYLKKDEDINEVFSKLGEFIDLSLYDMKRFDNALYFELNDKYVKENLADFLKEVGNLNTMDNLDYSRNIKFIENNLDKSMDYILDNCDDFFKERFRMQDVFSINNFDYYLDVLCYVFYFDGPFDNGNFKNLLKYLHKLQRNVLSNPLRDALCFGVNS